VKCIKSELDEARRKGVKLGRLEAKELVAKHVDIARTSKACQSVRKAAKIRVKWGCTVQRTRRR
jgi:hypothetical protein